MRLAQSLLLDAPAEPGHLTVYEAVTACRFSFALYFDTKMKLRTLIAKQKKENGESYYRM